MSKVWSCNEWDPLEEVIIGTATNARYPFADPSTRLAEFPERELDEIPQGPFPQYIIDEANEDLETFAAVLEQAGAWLNAPMCWITLPPCTTAWHTQGYYNYCPRDILLCVGDRIIETPSVIRGRSQDVQLSRYTPRLHAIWCALV